MCVVRKICSCRRTYFRFCVRIAVHNSWNIHDFCFVQNMFASVCTSDVETVNRLAVVVTHTIGLYSFHSESFYPPHIASCAFVYIRKTAKNKTTFFICRICEPFCTFILFSPISSCIFLFSHHTAYTLHNIFSLFVLWNYEPFYHARARMCALLFWPLFPCYSRPHCQCLSSLDTLDVVGRHSSSPFYLLFVPAHYLTFLFSILSV